MTYAIERILLATDMLPGTTRACRHTLGLAAALGAKVHVVHVLPPVLSGGEGVGDTAEDQTAEEELRRSIADRVAAMRSGWTALEGPTVPMEVRVVEGVAFEVILAEADRINAGMIVLGSHKRGLLRRLFEGSVANRVVLESKVPVLLIPVEDD